MTTSRRALAKIPASLWVVASCGVLAGALFAQEARSPQAAPLASALASALTVSVPPPATPHAALGVAEQAPLLAIAPAGAPGTGAAPNAALLALALVLAIGAAAVYTATTRAPEAPAASEPDPLELLGTLAVGDRWQVALVRVPGKTLVLGTTSHGLSLLTTLGDDEDVVEAIPEITGISVPIRPTPLPRAARVPTAPRPAAFLSDRPDAPLPTPPPLPGRSPSAEALRQRLERFQRLAG
ncbi:MAG: hypothetical protein EP329_05560 [Deltaproteobacteria bacterium]|nr:MAG: hypothetical protein EP329_05560 [Deltaproteobacteria bacterium]